MFGEIISKYVLLQGMPSKNTYQRYVMYAWVINQSLTFVCQKRLTSE